MPAKPLHATARTPGRFTDGAGVAIVAQALGTPLMPWQRHVADVACERNPDGTYAYTAVVITVPRQSGKTTLLRAMAVYRCIVNESFPVFYTAQTGKDARERWEDLVKQIAKSPLRSKLKFARRAGSERVVFPNGSEFRCFAPVATSLHGYTPPLVILDEAFAHSEATGQDLMGAITPAQSTLSSRQLWVVSTRGTATSTFLDRWIESGRSGDPSVAHFEWAAGPGVDVFDPAMWPTFHPALGITITAATIADAADKMPAAEFERAYGNRPTRTSTNLIPPAAWLSLAVCEDRPQSPPDFPPVLAYDVAADRSSSVIVSTWRTPAGQQARVVQSGPGVAWLAGALTAMRRKWPRAVLCSADDGPVREVNDELTVAKVKHTTIDARAMAVAWGQLLRHITDRTLTHDGTPIFSDAAGSVVTRPRGDVAVPSRTLSPADIAPMVALMVGLYVLDHRPKPQGLPEVRFA